MSNARNKQRERTQQKERKTMNNARKDNKGYSRQRQKHDE